MGMMLVHSRAIRAIGYDGYTLAIQFHTSDTLYHYPGVPQAVYDGLMRAPSMGAYYRAFIHGRYR